MGKHSASSRRHIAVARGASVTAKAPITNYAHYVGRVGALAVAFGIGAAVTLPGIAWADSGATDLGAKTAPDTSRTADPSPEPAGDGDTDSKSDEQTASADDSAGEDVGDAQDQHDESTGELAGPQGNAGEDEPTVDGVEASEPDLDLDRSDPDSAPGTGTPTAEVSPPPPADVEEKERAQAREHVPDASVAMSRPERSSEVDQIAENVVTQKFIDEAPAARVFTADPHDRFAARSALPGGADASPASPSSAPAKPQPSLIDSLLAIPGSLASGVLNLVSAVLAPVIGPGAPLDSPFLWGALTLLRRQFDQAFANHTPVLAPIQTSQDVDDGQVHGLLGGTDRDGDALTYTVPARGSIGGPVHGTVTVDQTAGTWTYTPDDNGTPTNFADDYRGSDSFAITVSDANTGFHVHALGATHQAVASVAVQINSTQVTPPTAPDPEHPYTPAPSQSGDSIGAVRGTVHATDPNGLPVSYSNGGPGTTADGSTVVVNQDGSFLYTPSDDARHESAAGAGTFTFTVKATNSAGASIDIPITVPVGPAINQDPIAAQPVVNSPVSGVVHGTVVVTDADQDGLHYVVLAQPSTGTVDIDPNTGLFTYTASAEARAAAAATPHPDSGSFTVVITDGHGGVTTADISVGISPSGVLGEVVQQSAGSVSAVSITYKPGGGQAIIASNRYDGTAFATSYTLIDIATGNVIGDPVSVRGSVNTALGGQLRPEFSSDGSRVVVYTWAPPTYGSTGEIFTTRVAIIDTATGAQIGSTIVQTGAGGASFADHETRIAVITGANTIYGSDDAPTQVSVYDVVTGAQIGERVTLFDTRYSWVERSQDGTKAIFILESEVVDTAADLRRRTSSIAMVDLVTGAQIGETLQQIGSANGSVQFVAGDTRAVVSTSELLDYDADRWTTRVTVLDTATGDIVGTTFIVPGDAGGLSLAGETRAVVITSDGRNVQGATYISVIDTVTGTPVHASVLLPGSTYSGAELTSDGSRAVVTTSDYDSGTRLVVIDTQSGAQVGDTFEQSGGGESLLALDGTRAILVTNRLDLSGYTAYASVINTATGAQLGTTVSHVGFAASQIVADGTRTILTIGSNNYDQATVVIINNVTGAQVGQAITAAGYGYDVQLVHDDALALLVAQDSSTNSTHVSVIDTRSGEQIGDTVTRPGNAYVWTTDDEAYGLLIGGTTDASGAATTTITVIDIATGQTVGDDISIEGAVKYRIFNNDSSRAFFYSETADPSTFVTTVHLSLIDLNIGAQIGETIEPTGYFESWAFSGPDRAALITKKYDSSNDKYDVQMTIIDANTGAQVGDPLLLVGEPTRVHCTADGNYVVVTTTTYDSVSERSISRLAIVDLHTGATERAVLTQQGSTPPYYFGTGAPVFSDDGTQAILATGDYDATTDTGTLTITTVALPAG